MSRIVVNLGILKIQGLMHQMKRLETIFLFLIAFFIVWVFTCFAHPFVGLILLSAAFAVFLGFFFFMLVALWYAKSK